MRFTCSDLAITFGHGQTCVQAVDGLFLEGGHGEFVSLIGPSGCGKTTMLRALAGMLQPTRGAIEFEPGPGSGPGQRLMVYQEDSLFPWMTVIENAAFGLEMNGVSHAERSRAAREMLKQFGLNDREHAYPHQISAGMKQRVAVIRAFLSNPELLLMDEPFGALDSPTRLALQTELLQLWAQSAQSVVFVTHDVDEAILLSDRVIVMSAAPGRVIAEVKVDLPRHARRDSMLNEKFLALKSEVLAYLQSIQVVPAMKECHVA